MQILNNQLKAVDFLSMCDFFTACNQLKAVDFFKYVWLFYGLKKFEYGHFLRSI